MVLAEKVIALYRANGQNPERLGATIERVGLETFKKAIV
jgi:dissimilatory sulfite reductase (desulfoviridin) alpha/beta subunit